MGPFQNILVPVDFGDATEPAIDLSTKLARVFDAQITLIHAFDVTPFMTMSPLVPPLDVEPVLASLEGEMKGLVERTRARWPRVEGLVRRGLVYQTVLDLAKARRCDLIIIGTHGRRGVAHVLLGSVAEKVVRLSTIPVLTVHPAPEDAKAASAA